MTPQRIAGAATLLAYAALPVVAVILARGSANLQELLLDGILSTIPMVLLASVTWRLVWPRWKLFAKLLVHPSIYAILSFWVGHWSILVAWVHQGVIGLGGHIWFCKAHGFKWYSVQDPDRYVELSKQATERLAAGSKAAP
jgi:hypothetical protein